MRIAGIVLLLAAAAAVAAPPAAPPAAETAPGTAPAAAGPRARVIIRVNRQKEVSGYLEYEDDDIIVVRSRRDPDGDPESFAKSRVNSIVRLTEPAPGQEGVVYLLNGQIRDGIIVEDGFDHVVVKIEGIPVRLKREVVDHVVLEPSFEERYERFRAALRPNMHTQRLTLCRWLIDHRRYDLAETELAALLDDAPDLGEARRLMRIVRAQLELEPDSPDDPAADPRPALAADVPPRQPSTATPAAGPSRVLTAEEANLVRVYEIDFERPPKVAVDADTVRALLEGYGTSPLIPTAPARRNALFRADPVDVVRLMFELRARELYGRIEVLSEPWALNLFRQRVHDGWLMNSCATSRCHGGGDGGRLQLHRRYSKDRRIRYTNLLILERLEIDPQWPLIDYDEPGLSLLIQYGLPRDRARRPHPDVRGWKPIFGRGSDRLRLDAIAWIEAMMKPRPDYGIDFDPNLAPDEPPAGDPAFDGDRAGR